MGFLGDFALILISQKREEKKIKEGKEKNKNLSNELQLKIEGMEKRAENVNSELYYELGLMFLQDSSVGYDPQKALKYFDEGRKKKNFNCSYAMALYYKGYWSYQHLDDYKSYMCYLDATDCVTDNQKYMIEAKKALKEDFIVESTKKDGIKITLIKDIKIR